MKRIHMILSITAAFLLVTNLFMGQIVVAAGVEYSTTPDQNAYVTDGIVNAVAVDGATTYIGGLFHVVGRYTGCGTPISISTGTALASYSQVHGRINAVIADGTGGWYIGGAFTTSDGTVTRNNLAHIRADGSLDPTFSPEPTGGNTPEIIALAVNAGTIYVGGNFTTIGGQQRTNIAALNSSNGTATSWKADANKPVRALALSTDKLYAGGDFTSIGGLARKYIAAITFSGTSGSIDSWNPSWNPSCNTQNNPKGSMVNALLVKDGIIYAGGSFYEQNSGNYLYLYLVAIDSSGNRKSWNPRPDNAVNALAINGDTLYAGGLFNSVYNNLGACVGREHITAFNISTTGMASSYGELITSWHPNLPAANTIVNTIAVSGTTVYIGGDFDYSIGNESHNNIAAITSTGTVTPWNPIAGGAVNALAVGGNNSNTIYAGGSFNSINGVVRNYLAALDYSGAPTTWNPNPDGYVKTLAVNNHIVYAGGDFDKIAGKTRGSLAAIDASGIALDSWYFYMSSNPVLAIKISGDTAYVGGGFSSIRKYKLVNNVPTIAQDETRYGLAAIKLSTGEITSWNPSVKGGSVYAIEIIAAKVYAGGTFTKVNWKSDQVYTSRPCLASFDASKDTDNVTVWKPGITSSINALTVSGNILYAGGYFTPTGQTKINHLAAWDISGDPINNLMTSFAPNPSGRVYALSAIGDTIYAGGNFPYIGSTQSHNAIAAVNSNGTVSSWDPDLKSTPPYSPCISTIVATPEYLYISGSFDNIGTTSRSTFARFPAASSDASARYVDNGDGTVTDTKTKLAWQKADNGLSQGWSNACSYCDNLVLGGYSDWRLPRVDELITLIEYNYGPDQQRPINPIFSYHSSGYWSSTPRAFNEENIWVVSFIEGKSLPDTKQSSYFYRCVRGGPYWNLAPDANRFVVVGSNTIQDTKNGTLWQQFSDQGARDWYAAQDYCDNLQLYGYNDWRLPSIEDMQSIVDYTKSNPATNDLFKKAGDYYYYWSGTTKSGNPNIAWDLALNYGYTEFASKNVVGKSIRCMRGGTAPPVVDRTLSITKINSGSGVVTSIPEGIACGTNCSKSFPERTKVTIKAQADSGSSFTGWTGAGCFGTGDCLIPMYGDYIVTASFIRSTATYSISGTVISGTSSLPDVTLTLSGAKSATATSDTWGRYTFTGIANGSYTVTPSKTGYTFTPAKKEDINLNNADISGINFTGTIPTTTYTITASVAVGANGSISPSGAVSVNSGESKSFTITPYANYRVSNVLVDGVSVGAVTNYTFYNVTANHAISASFTLNTTSYTITASAGANGSISPSGAISVNSGTSKTFTITPNTNYIANVLVDGASVGAVTSYTFNNVTANHAISVSFALNTYTITANAGANGSISPSGSVSVNSGTNKTFTITANTNYHVADVLVDYVSVGAVTSYTFTNVTTNHTISASFTLNTTSYTITATAGANGSISPSGAVSVNSGTSKTFTITPNTNYIANVLVDGASVGAVSSYTFSNVTANHTISAAFTAVTCPQISVNPTSVARGGMVTIAFSGITNPTTTNWIGVFTTGAADTAYKDYLYAGSGTKSPGAAKAFGSCQYTANLTEGVVYECRIFNGWTRLAVSNSFTVNSNSSLFTITASTGSNGSISPSGAVSVNSGTNKTFTITPNTNYRVADVLVDGTSAGAVTSYTFSNVTANHTIAANFTQNTATTYTITASAGSNGSISPSGSVSVNSGTSKTFTITPNTNYIANVLVDGASVGAVSSYTFSNVTANHTISATFTAVTGPQISVNPTSVARGGMVTIAFSGITNPITTNWIGFFVKGADNRSYTAYIYANSGKTSPDSTAKVSSGSWHYTIPSNFTNGDYECRIFDGWTRLAVSNTFTVQ